jgi:hypothetical protein
MQIWLSTLVLSQPNILGLLNVLRLSAKYSHSSWAQESSLFRLLRFASSKLTAGQGIACAPIDGRQPQLVRL